MATSTNATLVPLAEYLDTVYRPDCDWLDGELKERNMGETPHASVQGFLSYIFRVHGDAWGVWAFPEQRVQTSASNYRVADVCVVLQGEDVQPILVRPPLLCVEILSRGDSMTEMQERVDEYLTMGARMVWIIDPRRRKAFGKDARSMTEVLDELTVPNTAIAVPVRQLFAELNRIEGKS
jgi:Uma2 family endonuclease